MLFERSLDGAHTAQVLLQFRFRVPISFVERLDGVFEIVKLAELMGNVWKHEGHGTSDRFFPVGDDALDRDLEGLQKLLDFLEQGRDVPLSTTEEWASQEDFLGEAIEQHPHHLVAHVGL